MLIAHLLAGIVEGIVTAGVLAYIRRVSPEIIHADSKKAHFGPLYIMLLVMTVLTPIGLLASGTAWGEWAAGELQKMNSGRVPLNIADGFRLQAPMQDYNLPALKSDIAGYLISAVAGAAVLLIVFRLASSFFKKAKD
jgi:cobalt/nickel transport system permease protein